jgi:hypothetical protein
LALEQAKQRNTKANKKLRHVNNVELVIEKSKEPKLKGISLIIANCSKGEKVIHSNIAS